MKLTNPYKTLPRKVLNLILKEFIKDGISYDDMETIYEDTGTIEGVEAILKKFGFTDLDYEDIGFFAELFMLNEGNIDGELIVPKPKKFNITFRVVGRKWYTEWWELDYTAYNRSFVNDMFSQGDLSYYDGTLVDEDITESETDDWEIRDIEEIKNNIQENISKKPLFESEEELNNELKELRKLKMVIEERIRLLTP